MAEGVVLLGLVSAIVDQEPVLVCVRAYALTTRRGGDRVQRTQVDKKITLHRLRRKGFPIERWLVKKKKNKTQ